MEHLISKVPNTSNQIHLDNNVFYTFLDKNLYIKRNDKLKIYRQLGLIVCNSSGFTSVIYDKETKKSQRKIVLDIVTYKLLRALYETEIDN